RTSCRAPAVRFAEVNKLQSRLPATLTSNEEYVLGFSPNMTLGHYDLLIRTRATQAKTGKTVKRAVWDGTSYKPRSFQGQ
ncbi:hypothetical protein, partial [Burkholderia ubonensis]|uniref:hypothetical protein n=1 Tax=Burkholderia ubonensis TaxID=101571 RepID=UPI001E306314